MKLKNSDFSRVFYVEKNGSDNNNGSKMFPFATIDYAVSKVTQDNTLIRIGKGEFDKHDLTENSKYKVSFIGKNEKTIIVIKGIYELTRFSSEVKFYNMIMKMDDNFKNYSSSYNPNFFYTQCDTKVDFYNIAFIQSDNDVFPQNYTIATNCSYNSNKSFYNCTFNTTTVYIVNRVANFINCASSNNQINPNNNSNVENTQLNCQFDNSLNLTDPQLNTEIGVYSGDFKWCNQVILIRKDNKYYAPSVDSYNEELYKYNELTDLSDISDLSTDDPFEYQDYLPDNKRPIDIFSGKINLIKLEDGDIENFSIMKSNRELVVAKDDIVNKTASTINSITLDTNVSDDAKLKLALSIDKGKTWLTNSGGLWIKLNCNIPSKEYSLLNEEELNEWNNARDEIYENGIDSSEFNNINFNTLTETEVSPDYIRFAYVIDRPTVNYSSSTTKMTWDYNSKGTMEQMINGTDYTVRASDEQITFISKIDNDMIKINIEL